MGVGCGKQACGIGRGTRSKIDNIRKFDPRYCSESDVSTLHYPKYRDPILSGYTAVCLH